MTPTARAARLTLGLLAGLGTAPARAGEPSPEPEKDRFEFESLGDRWIGDLDAMIAHRRIRVLVPYSRSTYWVELGKPQGLVYEAFTAYAAQVNRKLRGAKRHLKTHVLFVPTRKGDLIAGLLEGRGDIAAAGLTITPGREEQVAFSDPLLEGVREVVVTGPEAPPIASLEDLVGQEVFVRKSSTYYEHLTELNERRQKDGKNPLSIRALPEELEEDDIVEMVHAGLIGTTVLDDYKAAFWAQAFKELQIHSDLAIHEGGEIAWMMRKDSPQLAASLATFIKANGKGTRFGNTLIKKYLRKPRLADAKSPRAIKKFDRTVALFDKYGERYDVDSLLMLAQGFQESRLDQNARSPVGAIGVMQIMPLTGAEMRVGDIQQLEPNIHGGVKYIRWIIDRYYTAATIAQFNRVCFAFAAYNAGVGRIQQLRDEAPKRGLDPDVWFDNVEIIAANRIGAETVDYVANILKYFTAYRDVEEHRRQRAEDLGASQGSEDPNPLQQGRPH